MSKTSSTLALLCVGIASISVPHPARAQSAQTVNTTITTLHTFDKTYGSYPLSGIIQAADGNFYGVAEYGGDTTEDSNDYGTIYRLEPITHKLTTLIKFNGNNGAEPNSLVQAADGTFYGTTFNTVFSYTAGGTLKTLHQFNDRDKVNGTGPTGNLVQASDGSLYGTTVTGGSSSGQGRGLVYRIAPGGTFSIIHKFGGPDGKNPYGGLTLGTDGNFYGTTEEGGTYDMGVIFKMTPSGTETVMHNFDGAHGANPTNGLTLSTDGNFYGVTRAGGIPNNPHSQRLWYRLQDDTDRSIHHTAPVQQRPARQ